MPMLMLLAAVVYVPALPSGSSSPRWWVLALGAAILAGSIRGLRPTAEWWVFAAVVFTATCSLLWSPVAWDGAHLLIKLLILTLLALAVRLESLDRVWDALAIGVSLCIGYEAAVYLGWFQRPPGAVPPDGSFYNKNFWADAAALALVAQFMRREIKALYILPLIVILVITKSAAAIGATGVGCLAALWVRGDRELMLPATFVAALVAVVGVVIKGTSSFDHRLDIWWTVIQDLTWTGHGLGSFSIHYPLIERAHNDLLELAFDLGVGVSGIIALLVWALIRGEFTREKVIFVSFLCISCFSFPLHNPLSAAVAAVCVGALMRQRAALRDLQSDSRAVCSGGIPAGWYEQPAANPGAIGHRRRAVSTRSSIANRPRGASHKPAAP